MQAAQLLTLLQLSDSAFPIGAFAHSVGLETYAQRPGFTLVDVESLLRTRLHAAATGDLLLIREAMRAFVSADLAALAVLDALCAASKPAQEARQASEKIGWRLLDNALTLYPHALLNRYHAAVIGAGGGHHAVVHGVVFASVGVPYEDAALAFLSGLVMQQAYASVKLLAIGQTQAQQLIVRLQALLPETVAQTEALTLEDYASFTPGLEIAQMQHTFLDRRLFIS